QQSLWGDEIGTARFTTSEEGDYENKGGKEDRSISEDQQSGRGEVAFAVFYHAVGCQGRLRRVDSQSRTEVLVVLCDACDFRWGGTTNTFKEFAEVFDFAGRTMSGHSHQMCTGRA